MHDLDPSQLQVSFDPATDSDQHSLREFIDLVADAGYVVDSD
ncbi:conserved domain protein [ [[Propionibacterium] namnetense SK182B-JCVI]|uniref:Conserved domain protein n=2 Tax=Cutibacterium namnetense TaxID=1574624 RepID=F9NT38_9ACTN|nr:conserved domain protein [ [[Propionibacterium] namnetense SK182B-JCVI]